VVTSCYFYIRLLNYQRNAGNRQLGVEILYIFGLPGLFNLNPLYFIAIFRCDTEIAGLGLSENLTNPDAGPVMVGYGFSNSLL